MSGGGCGSSTLDFERLRARYRPERIVALFVGQSPPAGGTFFYFANSNLYRHTERAFREALDYRIGADSLPPSLRSAATWMVSA